MLDEFIPATHTLGEAVLVRIASKNMLDAKDIQVLREMFAEQDVRIDGKFNGFRDEMDTRFTGLRDEMDTRFTGLRDEIEEKIDRKFTGFRDEIFAKVHSEVYQVRDDIIAVINTGVLPQIDKLDRRVTRLERWARMT